MEKPFLLILAFLVAVVTGLFYLAGRLPSAPGDDGLLEPRVHAVPSQRMLVASGRGDPNRTAGPAFASLYKAYWKHVDKPWKRRPEAPRARWAEDLGQKPKEEWEGRYGLPLPADADIPADAGVQVEVWEYGAVAEILHVGPYHAEAATVQRLREYIGQEGYRIVGDHEEIYLKGPGMFLRGNPERYRTLIRYRVAPRKE